MIINLSLLFVIGIGLWLGVINQYINSVAKVSLEHKESVAIKSIINYYEDLVVMNNRSCMEKKQCEDIKSTLPDDAEYSCDDIKNCTEYSVSLTPAELTKRLKDMSGVKFSSTGASSIMVGRHSKFIFADKSKDLYKGFYYSTKSYSQCVASFNNLNNFSNIGVSANLLDKHIAPGTKESISYTGYPSAGHSTPEGACLGVSPVAKDGYIWIKVTEG